MQNLDSRRTCAFAASEEMSTDKLKKRQKAAEKKCASLMVYLAYLMQLHRAGGPCKPYTHNTLRQTDTRTLTHTHAHSLTYTHTHIHTYIHNTHNTHNTHRNTYTHASVSCVPWVRTFRQGYALT